MQGFDAIKGTWILSQREWSKNDMQIAGLGPWVNGAPFTEIENTKRRLRLLRLWGNQEFSFGHGKHGMPVKHLSGDVMWEACLESRETIWAGHINWRIINIAMEFQVWGTCVEGEGKRCSNVGGTLPLRGFGRRQRAATGWGKARRWAYSDIEKREWFTKAKTRGETGKRTETFPGSGHLEVFSDPNTCISVEQWAHEVLRGRKYEP